MTVNINGDSAMKGGADALASFHPTVRRWFSETIGSPSAPQRAGWPAIASGSDTLILAPTGTGKTLAAFLWELNALITDGLAEPLANAVHLLYISPLKALNNDVQRNLELPLAQLKARFEQEAATENSARAKNDPDFLKTKPAFPVIRVAVRTGDTPASARARMLRTTPHILITTPESLHILLTSVRGRSMFSALRAVIVDEIHAVAGTKRGAHLALTLERLAKVAPQAPQRIGLSATQKPLDEVARFLSGCEGALPNGSPQFRPVSIVDCGLVKQMDVRVASPVPDLAQVDGTIWTKVAPMVLEQIQRARTTLVFVNNRGQSERMAARLNTIVGEEIAQPYHGSLSRERRFLLEERLKAGELRALVTTSSLELGIDVGSVDLVVQLQSPKRVSAALQRVGRAGHSLDAVSRGLFVPTFRDDALEQLAILDAMRDGDVEPTRVVQNALDVLSQLIVAIVASEEPEWTSAALFEFVRRAYPYHTLTRTAFDETLAMLSGKYPSDVAAELQARITWNRANDVLTPSRGSRLVATISGGTIPDRGLYTVHLSDKTRLGELDEEFVHESRVGDAFQLGSSTWRIQAIEHDRVVVIPAPGAPARMPFWHGEFMARSMHLTPRVGTLRRLLSDADTPESLLEIQRRYAADESTVRSLAEYVRAQRDLTEIVPDEKRLVLEHFRDEVGSIRLVLHAPFGGRVNAPWGMALGRRMRERLGVEVQVQTTDDGLMLRLPDMGAVPPVDVIRSLAASEAEQLVLEEVGASSLFGARFRMNAARALLLPRGKAGRRMPLWLQRLKSLDLLQAVREYPSFPIVVETYRDVLQDAFDMPGLQTVLSGIATGTITVSVVETQIPSPFASSLQFGFVIDHMYGDDTPRAEQRATFLSLDRVLLDELLGGEGADDDTLAALDELLARRRGTAPGRQARDVDELAQLIDRAGDVTYDEMQARVAPASEWLRGDPVHALLSSGRVVRIDVPQDRNAEPRYILIDSYPRYVSAFGRDVLARVRWGLNLDEVPAEAAIPVALLTPVLDPPAARREILHRWIALAGVFSVDDVLARYQFERTWVDRRIAAAEQKQIVVRGVFGGERTVSRWCSRRLLEQARRRELAQVRKLIEAVSASKFAAFVQRWQHVVQPAQLEGSDAAKQALAQLQGVARGAGEWTREILPARIRTFDIKQFSELSANGTTVWAAEPRKSATAPFNATTVGRVRFFPRGTGALWLPPPIPDSALSDKALQTLAALRSFGASFTLDLSIATKLGPQATRDALKELVSAGLVTNDNVSTLRDFVRWQPVVPEKREDEPDATRWLPADFKPSPGRPFTQRRRNARRLPRWRRADWEGEANWSGRWALVHTPGTLGAYDDVTQHAEQIARVWLARYGIVSRDWYVLERPPVPWRDIYHELKRLEFRGDVQRGYFVAGLAGAQFGLPEAVEMLRASHDESVESIVVLSATDPANVYALKVHGGASIDPLGRPRGKGALLFTRGGRIVMTAESKGARLRLSADATESDVRDSALALIAHYAPAPGTMRRKDVVVETIDGEKATRSRWAPVMREVGMTGQAGTLRF
ncbi:MAG: DEAD/DEAH box helicase [Phycisphaerae bacterium]|nr:DEAD/DEAH box helicase [Gemmatimonadaceae bacterium]